MTPALGCPSGGILTPANVTVLCGSALHISLSLSSPLRHTLTTQLPPTGGASSVVDKVNPKRPRLMNGGCSAAGADADHSTATMYGATQTIHSAVGAQSSLAHPWAKKFAVVYVKSQTSSNRGARTSEHP